MNECDDLIGRQFGRLTIVRIERETSRKRRLIALCTCECGAQETPKGIRLDHLQRGGVVSCGCYQRELNRTHGYTTDYIKTPEYKAWQAMRYRCNKPDHPSFADYGGRGISVCPEWSSFGRFIADMGPRPSNRHSLDRRDNDGPYAPWNCRWATTTEQAMNKRGNHRLTYNGETLPVKAWANRTGINPMTLVGRLKMGWSMERTLTTPVVSHGRPHARHQVAR